MMSQATVPPAIFLAVRSLVPALFGWPGAVFPPNGKRERVVMTIVISLAIQGPLLPGTAAGPWPWSSSLSAAARPRVQVRAARAARSGHAGREPVACGRGADSVVDHGRMS